VPVVAQVVFASEAVFTLAASKIGVDEDVVAFPHPAFGTPLPLGEGMGVREIHRDDLSRTIRAGNVWHFEFQAGPAIAYKNIHSIERGGM